MKRYLELFSIFFRTSLMADLEYRLNMTLKFFTDIIWYIGQLSVFEVLFYHAPNIAGWSLPEMRIFMGVLFVVDALWMILLSENLDRLSYRVRNGDLDLLLVKPVNSQFILSLQKMNTAYLANCVLAVGYLTWAVFSVSQSVSFVNVFWLVLAIPFSLLIVYSFRFFFACLSVIFVNSESIGWIWYQVYRFGTRPDSMYPRWLRYMVLSIVPVGFIASVPTQLILGRSELWMFVALPLLAVTFLLLSNRFWTYALKKYSSASS